MKPADDYLAARRRRTAAAQRERRAAGRAELCVGAELEFDAGWLPGQLEDASSSGALFATAILTPELRVGAVVVLVLQPHGSLDRCHLPAVVVGVDAHLGPGGSQIVYALTFDVPTDMLEASDTETAD